MHAAVHGSTVIHKFTNSRSAGLARRFLLRALASEPFAVAPPHGEDSHLRV